MKLIKNISLYTLLIILISSSVLAQNKIEISEGLAVQTKGLNRRSLKQVDPIEYKLVKKLWKSPQNNETFSFLDSTYQWMKINSDSTGWFRDKNLSSGYLYTEIHSDKDQVLILEGKGYTHSYVNEIPRYGNVYKFTENRNPWEPEWGFLFLPVKLKKGKNEFLFQSYYGGMKAVLHKPKAKVQLNIIDLTDPTLVTGEASEKFGAVVVLNNTEDFISGYKIKTSGEGFKSTITELPNLIPLCNKKVRFNFSFDGSLAAGDHYLTLHILDESNKTIHTDKIKLEVKQKGEPYKETFVSNIDGSVQYYAVNPSSNENDKNALFLSLHGAAVEAYNQVRSYSQKNWGTIVSPTNRRPYGFNWEDWGRQDAVEVLQIAKEKFKYDNDRIYLTGHSMGGHGTWHLGATFPDLFAAIGPSAGWISFDSYRYKNKKESKSEIKKLIDRTGTPSDTYSLVKNYYNHGIYIIHGKDDKVVTVKQPYSIMEKLKTFHKDYQYYEEPGAGHWWDNNDEDGADCVDWQPLFDFFAKKSRYNNFNIRHIKYKTAFTGISSKYYWIEIYDQEKYFEFSEVDLDLYTGKNQLIGNTKNIKVLKINAEVFNQKKEITLNIDNQILKINKLKSDYIWLIKDSKSKKWLCGSKPDSGNKNPLRAGSFKEAFKNNMLFVYGTNGNSEENKLLLDKVKYDAEQFWYQGNGSIEIISDEEYDQQKYSGRNVILYGNSETNQIWSELLVDCPIQVYRNKLKVGDKTVKGDDLICLMIYPKKGETNTSVGVVASTGVEGSRLLIKRPYLKPGFTYPDFTIMNSDILLDDEKGYKGAGFFGSDWSLKNGEIKLDF